MGSWMARAAASTAVRGAAGIAFPHRRQIQEWDCGAACAYSIMRGLDEAATDAAGTAAGESSAAVSPSAATALPRRSSSLLYGELLHALSPCEQRIWSIDLAYLLCACGVRGVRMLSARLGVDPAHGLKPFYDHFEADQRRVESVFKHVAQRNDMSVQQQSISGGELAALLRSGHCCILLVDQRLLDCDQCYTAEQQRDRSAATEFAGHFILVAGVTEEADDPMVLYLDPDARHAPCSVRLSVLDRARLSDGTDEDCILVDCAQNRGVRISLKQARMAIGFEPDETDAKRLQS